MLPYILLTGLVGFLSGLNGAIQKQLAPIRNPSSATREPQATVSDGWSRKTSLDLVIVVLLVAFCGLRFDVGTDYPVYVTMFQSLDTSDWAASIRDSPVEVGYTVLLLITATWSTDPAAMFLASSALAVAPVYLTIKKASPAPTFSLMLYVLLGAYLAPFNVVRQGIAVALILYGATFYRSNKTAYVALSLAAGLFHAAAFLALLIQLATARVRPSPALLGGALLIGIAVSPLTALPFVRGALESLNPQYLGYLDESRAGLGTYLGIAFSVGLVAYMLTLARRSPAYETRYLTYAIIAVGFQVAATFSVVLARMDDYFSIFLLILLPQLIRQVDVPAVHKLAVGAVASGYFALTLLNYGDLIPYQSVL